MPRLPIARNGITALLAAALLTAIAQAQVASTTDTIYQLHGNVINGISNAPVARALVQSADRRIAVMTDSEGRFSIDIHVPTRDPGSNGAMRGFYGRYAQQIALMVRKPGFLAPDQTLLSLDDKLSSTDVRLKIMPTATFSARISAAGADSAAGVRVILLHRGVDDDGNRVWQQAGFHQANAEGIARFTNLRPGDYTVMTADWAGPQPPPSPAGQTAQRYPPTYTGDTMTLAAATQTHLRYGDAVEAEVHLHQTTYYPVTIPVSASDANTFISARIVDVEPMSGYQFIYNRRLGGVTGRLPSGHYSLVLTGGGPQQAFATVSLNVNGAPVTLPGVALASIPPPLVRVSLQYSSQHSQRGIGADIGFAAADNTNTVPMQMILRSEDIRSGQGMSFSRPGTNPGELIMQNIAPGRYLARPQVWRGYAASVTTDGVDLLAHPLTVSPGNAVPTIDVVIRDDTATLDGEVTSAAGALPDHFVLLILPASPTARLQSILVDNKGTFRLAGIAPGDYRAVALRTLQQRQLPYRDPDFIRNLDGKATSFSLSAGQQTHIDVRMLDDAELESD